MSIWNITEQQARLIASVGRHQPTDEISLANDLGWRVADVSGMVRSLIPPILGCPAGLLLARVTHMGGQADEHVSDVRLTPLGQSAYMGRLGKDCPICGKGCGAVISENTRTACNKSGEAFFVDAMRHATRLQVSCG